MSAMIQNDDEKEWMLPLLELRNDLDISDDRHLRDFRRMNGLVQIFNGRNIPGPYTQTSREHWLRRVLEAQTWIRRNAPENVRNIELISLPELHEIRRIWVTEKHELEDSLPRIYQEATGDAFPSEKLDANLIFGAEEIEILREICGENQIHFELSRELLGIAQRFRTQSRRAGLYDALERALKRNFYDNETDAVDRAMRRHEAIEKARSGEVQSALFAEPNSENQSESKI